MCGRVNIDIFVPLFIKIESQLDAINGDEHMRTSDFDDSNHFNLAPFFQ